MSAPAPAPGSGPNPWKNKYINNRAGEGGTDGCGAVFIAFHILCQCNV